MSSNSSSEPRVSIIRRVGIALALAAWVFTSFMLAQAVVFGFVFALQASGIALDTFNPIILNSIGNAAVYVLAIAIVVGAPWLILKRRTTLKDLGLHRLPTWMDMLLAPGGAIVYFIVTALLASFAMAFLPFVDYTQAQETGFANISGQLEYILAFFSLVVIAPVAEEVLFRGYLLGKLRRHVPIWGAVLITSLLFAVIHFQWNVGIDVFALSLVLCTLRIVSGSLWPSIMLHMIKNGIAFYFLFINPIVAITIGG